MLTVQRQSYASGGYSVWHIFILPTDPSKISDVVIPSLENSLDENGTHHGYAASEKDGIWKVIKVNVTIAPLTWKDFNREITVRTEEQEGAADLAYPIDPRMIESDIEGAKYIEPNADNTGWLFYHETVGERRDHELQLMAVVEGVFRPVFQQYGYDFLRNYTPDHAALAKERHSIIASFYGQFIQAIQVKSRSATLSARHISHHFDDGHLYGDLHTVYEAEKKKWIDANTDEDFGKVSGAFAFIDRRLTIPAPETRWGREERLAAEAKRNEETDSGE